MARLLTLAIVGGADDQSLVSGRIEDVDGANRPTNGLKAATAFASAIHVVQLTVRCPFATDSPT
jgi:hypothetical protein